MPHHEYLQMIGLDWWNGGAVATAPAGEPTDEQTAILVDDSFQVATAEDVPFRTEAAHFPVAETLERIVALLAGGGTDAAKDALREIVRASGAIGAWFGEWPGRGEPRIAAFCGALARTSDQPEVRRFFDEAWRGREREPFCVTTVIENGLRYACGAFGRRGTEMLTLVMWGEARARFDDPAPLRIFLRMADRLREPRDRGSRIDGELEPLPVQQEFPAGHLPGRSRAMLAMYRQMRLLAAADFPLVVIGETGVGKEDVVRTIHAWSRRKRGPFVAVNCAAIPDTLLEAEMFGVGRGVASGVNEREGKFRMASGGTLFLDEIGELPMPLQAKLLRVLQDNQVTPVGAVPVDVDLRVVAATNADLEQRMRAGLFRSDLYYRITGSVVRVPPLRERRSDAPRLVEHFLRKFSAELDRPVRGISVRALELMVQHSWPGNVRQLEHEVRRLVYTCPPGRLIDSTLLSESIGIAEPKPDARATGPLNLATRIAELERDLIREALQRSRGNRSVAARQLGLSRNGLALKMQRLDLD